MFESVLKNKIGFQRIFTLFYKISQLIASFCLFLLFLQTLGISGLQTASNEVKGNALTIIRARLFQSMIMHFLDTLGIELKASLSDIAFPK